MIIFEVVGLTVTVQETIAHEGGPIQIQAQGVFDTATLNFEVNQDGLGFLTVGDYTQLAPSTLRANLKRSLYRFSISGNTASTMLQVSVI